MGSSDAVVHIQIFRNLW